MRTSPFLLLALAATPAAAKPALPLGPFQIVLPYAPESPKPLAPDHPLYRQIVLDPVQGMPKKIGGFLTPITNAEEFGDTLRTTLEQANMLASAGKRPGARLSVLWRSIDAPAKISFSSSATVTVTYLLRRVDTGQTIFQRDIVTLLKSKGGDASERLKGNARLAITANLASAIVCLDKAATGPAPADCALRPLGTFQAPRMPLVMFLPR